MSREFLCGTWQISKCFRNEQVERLGLEGIKFRLDDMGDITWYNDLSHLTAATGPADLEDIRESTDVLFSCETYEVLPATTVHGPELLFVAIAGYSIEFTIDTLQPDDHLSLHCDGWYTLQCSRVAPADMDDTCATGSGHDAAFTLLLALENAPELFSDCVLESRDGQTFAVHSSILRLSGFDASSCCSNDGGNGLQGHGAPGVGVGAARVSPTRLGSNQGLAYSPPKRTPSQLTAEITIAVIPPLTNAASDPQQQQQQQNQQQRLSTKAFLLSPKLLISPTTIDMFNLPSKLASNLSNSFNCLAATPIDRLGLPRVTSLSTSPSPPASEAPLSTQLSTSDSNLQSARCTLHNSGAAGRPNIFTFSEFSAAAAAAHQQRSASLTAASRVSCCPPLSPYRSKSPLWSSNDSPPPLSPLTPAQVLHALDAGELAAVLHWMYAECLPGGLTEEQLVRLVRFADGVSRLGKLSEVAQSYLGLVRVKKAVVTVINDIHNCLNRIIQLLHPAQLAHDPLSLWRCCQRACTELALAAVKLLQFSNIFARDQTRLTRSQRHEIIKYVRSRVPIFLAQSHQALQHVRTVLGALTATERDALVAFLVPEVSATLALIRDIVAQLKLSLRTMYDELKAQCQAEQRQERRQQQQQQQQQYNKQAAATQAWMDFETGQRVFPSDGGRNGSNASKSLRVVLYMFELKRMREVYGRISAALGVVDEKRQAYDQMSAEHRAETLHQNLEQMMLAVPALIERLDQCSGNLETLNGWKEFKLFFKLATNQINGLIAKLLDHQAALNETLAHICQLIARLDFTETLVDLGLLQPSSAASVAKATTGAHQHPMPSALHSACTAAADITARHSKPNLTQHCNDPPRQSVSSLAKNALRLLHSGQHSDMEFEIVVQPAPTQTTTALDDDQMAGAGAAAAAAASSAVQVHTFRAHRVIVATRCEWFHKALNSGMQESIHRRITIRDTSPVIFRRLLLYLYGAPVDRTVGAEPLCELMLLADRFSVDALKDICESTLRALIDEASVLCLLALADRLCATALKANCFAYVSQHADVVRSEVFAEMPRSLQAEVHELLLWCGRVPEPWRERKSSKKGKQQQQRSGGSSGAHLKGVTSGQPSAT